MLALDTTFREVLINKIATESHGFAEFVFLP